MTNQLSSQSRIEHSNGIDQPENLSTPIEQTVAYSFVHSAHRLHFDHPIAFLNTVIMVVLLRIPSTQHARGAGGAGRVALIGLKAAFDPDERITTWGPEPLFWIELPPEAMSHPHGRSSPTHDPRLGQLALALNRAAHRESQRGLPLRGGPLMPPTMLALSPGTYYETTPVGNSYVIRMAEIYRVSVAEVWPILADAMMIPANGSHVGAPLVDARLWSPSLGVSLGEYARLAGNLGRAVFNPARTINNVDLMEHDRMLQLMRSRLQRDLSHCCTDQDLRDAANHPGKPLYLSRVPRIGVFRLDNPIPGSDVFELSSSGQRVVLPLGRRAQTRSGRHAAPFANGLLAV